MTGTQVAYNNFHQTQKKTCIVFLIQLSNEKILLPFLTFSKLSQAANHGNKICLTPEIGYLRSRLKCTGKSMRDSPSIPTHAACWLCIHRSFSLSQLSIR